MPEDQKEISSGIKFSGKLDPSLADAVKKAGEHFDKLGEKIKELPKGISEFTEKILQLSGAEFLFEKLEDAVKDLASEWDHLIEVGEEHLAMQSRLQVALENQPHLIREGTKAVREQIEAVERLSKAQELRTTYSAAFSEDLSSRLVSIGIRPETGLAPLVKGFENELARRGQLSGTDADSQALEEALSQAFEGKTKGLSKLFPTLMLGESLKGLPPEQLIAQLIQALSRMPDFAGPLNRTAAGQIKRFQNVQEETEKVKGIIATNITAPFDDFLSHIESRLNEGPLKWLEEQTTSWGESIDKWVNAVAIPAWDRFTTQLSARVGPDLQATGKDLEDLVKNLGDETGMTGQLEKLQKGDFSGVIEGIDGAIKALNETIKATGPVLADLVKEFEGAFTDIKGVTKGFLEWWPKFRDWPKKSREEQWKDIQDWFNNQTDNPRTGFKEAAGTIPQAKRIEDWIASGFSSSSGINALDPNNPNNPKSFSALADQTEKLNLKFKTLTDTIDFAQGGSGIDWLPGVSSTGGVGGGGSGGTSSHGVGGGTHVPYRAGASGASATNYRADVWDQYLTDEANKYGINPTLLKAIVRQENVAASDLNPLGISNSVGAVHYGNMESAESAVDRQLRLMISSKGPYGDIRTKSIDEIAGVYSPIGAPNDRNKTNATEASGIKSWMGKLEKDGGQGTHEALLQSLAATKAGVLNANDPKAKAYLKEHRQELEDLLNGGSKSSNKSSDPSGNSNEESRKLRSTSEHPVTINNTVHVHAAAGQDASSIAEAVDKHLRSKAHEHADIVIQRIKDKRETLAA